MLTLCAFEVHFLFRILDYIQSKDVLFYESPCACSAHPHFVRNVDIHCILSWFLFLLVIRYLEFKLVFQIGIGEWDSGLGLGNGIRD